MSGLNIKVDRFTGRNSFSLWQIKMRALLKQQWFLASLQKKKKEGAAAVAVTAEITSLEEKAHSTIILCLDDDIITEVAEEETVAGLWAKLESLYMTKSLTNKLLLKQRLFNLRMGEGMPLRDHLDQLNTILLDLRNIDVKVDDEDAALILLVSLPVSYENFVQSFIVGKDTVTLEDVRSSLHTRELSRKAASTITYNQATGLVASGGYGQRNSGKKKFKNFSHSAASSASGYKGSKPTDVCNYCKEKGHWKFDYPRKKNQQENSGTVVVTDVDSEEDDYALITDTTTHQIDEWILDSGASYHICPRRERFTTYEQVDDGNISMANGDVCKAVGIGSIKIRTHDGKLCTLNEVRHVPLITKKLISLSKLDSKDFGFQSEGGVLNVYKGSNVILRGIKHGTLYCLQRSTMSGSIVAASVDPGKKQCQAVTRISRYLKGTSDVRNKQVSTADSLVDMFSKPVLHSKFQHCLDLLNIRSI
ncbi:hypothetical protein RND81_03G053700 [Saponaria officinalis]|uniref:Retrovirus-related Pol polyprotein from transposon TNT 1-94-like beta-barrel domain-containing protein n=1 Tax=Saponaria officinalis TaxID=3572 RepID=A0AAW1M4T2_SAPOF